MQPIHKAMWFAITVTVLIPPSVWSDTVAGLNEFVSGETAQSSEVNVNFTAIESAVNGNDALIGGLETRIENLEGHEGVPGPQGEAGLQGAPGPAGADAASLELIGFTTATITGGQGILGLNGACQSEFPDSRMCTSVEFMNATNVPEGLTGDAWLRPVFALIPSQTTSAIVGVDASGWQENSPGRLTCQGWSGPDTNFGLSVDSEGRFGRSRCDEQIHVACCRESQ